MFNFSRISLFIFICLIVCWQAVLCSLAGLEDFVVDETYINSMVTTLVGKVLVAQIVHRDDANSEYSLILYDTSGEIDVNLNEELINLINLEISKPELPEVRTHFSVILFVSNYYLFFFLCFQLHKFTFHQICALLNVIL